MRKALIDLLISLYGSLNRRGLFETTLLRSLFVHSYFFYKRHFEDPFYQLTLRQPELFRRGHLLDIGANIGYTAIVFAGALKVEHKVFAFEPEQLNFNRLEENLSRFGVTDRVVANCVAVGARDGSIDLWLNETHPGDHRTVTGSFRNRIQPEDVVRSVPVVSIDSFVEAKQIANRIGFIKVDVQGYEAEVCRGMERTLAINPRAVVAVEYAPGSMAELGFGADRLIDFFVARRFNLFVLESGGRLRAVRGGEIELEPDEWINLLCSREQL